MNLPEPVRKKLWHIATRKILKSPFNLDVQWEKPICVSEIFPPKKKFFLELGSGWGEVAISLAKENPDTGFVLLEKKPDRLKSTIQEIEKYNLENIRFLTANFNWFLVEFFEANSFDTILLNFPDPWPKKKHLKHRTFDEAFPNKLNHLLKKGGKFMFASDYGPYCRQVIRILRKQQNIFSDPTYQFSRPDFPISVFEEEKKSENKRIYYIETYKL
jgi:tRNA (guanine-N7-)-methyltransferase